MFILVLFPTKKCRSVQQTCGPGVSVAGSGGVVPGARYVYHLSPAILDELLWQITLHWSIGIKSQRQCSICAVFGSGQRRLSRVVNKTEKKTAAVHRPPLLHQPSKPESERLTRIHGPTRNGQIPLNDISVISGPYFYLYLK